MGRIGRGIARGYVDRAIAKGFGALDQFVVDDFQGPAHASKMPIIFSVRRVFTTIFKHLHQLPALSNVGI